MVPDSFACITISLCAFFSDFFGLVFGSVVFWFYSGGWRINLERALTLRLYTKWDWLVPVGWCSPPSSCWASLRPTAPGLDSASETPVMHVSRQVTTVAATVTNATHTHNVHTHARTHTHTYLCTCSPSPHNTCMHTHTCMQAFTHTDSLFHAQSVEWKCLMPTLSRRKSGRTWSSMNCVSGACSHSATALHTHTPFTILFIHLAAIHPLFFSVHHWDLHAQSFLKSCHVFNVHSTMQVTSGQMHVCK